MKKKNSLKIKGKKKHVVPAKFGSSTQEYIKTYNAVTWQYFTYIDKLRNYECGF